jgi:hypothetical protein
MAKEFNPRIQKRIQNLSRAINKIDPGLAKKTMGVQYAIGDVKMGINDFTYTKNGVETKVRYDAIQDLDRYEQASVLNKLSTERYELRQERALEQLKTKGKISEQFKRSIKDQNKKLYENIQEMEQMLQGNIPSVIQEEFEGADIVTGDDWFEEADSHFQMTKDGKKNTPQLFDFFRPGEAGGFSELNAFTWNTYKIMKGI